MEEKIRNLFLLLSELENKITSLPPQEKEYQKLVREYSRLKEIVPLAQKYILLIEEEKSTSPLLREENQEIVRM
ncbi:MAG TPA: hypothetical protein VJC03_04430, partial [bacterium]|nr:hypothetical protein [bacterium]